MNLFTGKSKYSIIDCSAKSNTIPVPLSCHRNKCYVRLELYISFCSGIILNMLTNLSSLKLIFIDKKLELFHYHFYKRLLHLLLSPVDKLTSAVINKILAHE